MWEGQRRKQELPADWPALRRLVKARAGGMCEHPGCPLPGTDCDHIGHHHDHTPDNLRWLCRPHHNDHTQAQAQAARAAIRAKLKHPMNRGNRW